MSENENKAEKKFISAQELLEDSVRLGIKILESGFTPHFIVGIWRGGTPVGIAVQELLDYFGVKTDHIAIRTSYYTGINQRGEEIRVHGLGYIVDHANHEDTLLIVDDVYDSGLSVQAVLANLKERARKNTPHDIRIATVYYKPANNKTQRAPDYYLYETDKWLVFPHELNGLTPEEILSFKPRVSKLIEGIKENENK
ncbi:MAG: hypoxanthine phosphoribosyltransferase [Candidatus Aminicenantes bacterium]|nr:hypoxanthine phosphoribosyltransferase [Candidatus Aminicenantes bacterium]NIM81239.1 hypoxanthine phosphoribosyltransferase [Candidatus Aminicenantes bacterium]NIN20614.1 hypoxanthine phosphoribosyltransferase [Candidatus Aminicenantes bacterium]NIN44393.1 hypoxanthine phosphoribosyltransferase [Candidatus Aminicenantes bacterium]NIN87212.1 hypoxanthine phosphoribosyltransferase [Candidatus Aminicenantes bacterium]